MQPNWREQKLLGYENGKEAIHKRLLHVCGLTVLPKRPRVLVEMLNDADQSKSQSVMTAILKTKKIDIDELERAAVPQQLANAQLINDLQKEISP